MSTYGFRPLTRADLPLVRVWLELPHVARWWGAVEQEMAEIESILDTDHVEAFIMLLDGREVGYFQYYDPHAEPGHPFADQPPGTLGIDLSIGEEALIGRGHGSTFIRSFVDQVFARGVPRVVTDPDPANAASVGAFAKAGFVTRWVRDLPGWGAVQFMTCDRPGANLTP
jgi:aminoglycoside 6'-N-acetyltransferase